MRISKWIFILAALVVSLEGYAAVPINGPTWYDYRDQSLVVDGKGTLLDPVVVSTPEQLAQVAWLVNESGNVFKDKVIVLAADIDLTKEVDGKRVQWMPIGLNSSFQGTFLGIDTRQGADTKRHSINGMYIDVNYSPSGNSYNPEYGYYGLFGRCDGFVGYLQMSDASISTRTGNYTYFFIQAGLLCGSSEGIGNVSLLEKSGGKTIYVPKGVSGVSVEGSILIYRGLNSYIGGIFGLMKEGEITHSTAKVNITCSGNIESVGGICGRLGIGTPENTCLVDCAADVTINCQENRTNNTGGIVGELNAKCFVKGCASSGTIGGEVGSHLGGICGYQIQDSNIMASISTVTMKSVDSSTTVGGISGLMSHSNGNFTTTIDGCVFAGHIDGSKVSEAGGICGYFDWSSDQHIVNSLFLGTMIPTTDASRTGAIIGYNPKPIDTVVGCYYDRQLFSGNPVGDNQTVLTIKGLSTRELTSGEIGPVSMLPIDDSAEYGFTLRDGFYPTVFCNTHTQGYDLMLKNNIGSETANRLLGSAVRDDNSLYKTGAWLASVPVSIRYGDCADDFVSTLTVSTIDDSWTEADGRTVSIYNDSQLPDAECINVDELTATAKANGTCFLTINAEVQSNGGTGERPKPIKGGRQMWLNVTVDRVWDGSIATACADGTGTAEDPFIIKNGAQLAYAVRNNQVGQFYEQICDITLNKVNPSEGRPTLSGSATWEFNGNWNATYDGCGHFVHGLRLVCLQDRYALFGSITSKGSVKNLGLASAYLSGGCAGLAYNMDGKISNCLVHGIYYSLPGVATHDGRYECGRGGGICYAVGPNNADAVIEDCVAAVFSSSFLSDYTPFVSLSETSKGVVRNCLAVVPTAFADLNFENRESFSAAGHDFIRDCYWLKGYEAANSGFTLQEISQALGRRTFWQTTDGYFPMLKTFATTDYGKLLAIPVRTDEDYDAASSFLLGFSHQLTFEPGLANWTCDGGAYIESDSEMGIVSPLMASFVVGSETGNQKNRLVTGIFYMKAQYGNAVVYIPIRSSDSNISPGITFVDDYARQTCLNAFDKDNNGYLSLAELKVITNEQTLTAFKTWSAQQIRQFPEFRLFKNVTTLTSQLTSLVNLETIKLPYALETLSAESFNGCSKLKTVTMPSKLKTVQPGAFYGSSIDTILVDPFNTKFVSRDGALFTTQKELVAWPNGRRSDEAVIEGTVKRISEGAFYKVPNLRRLYFDTNDYNTVPRMVANSIVTDNGSMIDAYVSDATIDQALFTKYKRDASWANYYQAGKLHQYYPLKIDGSVKGVDGEDETCYFGTFCIGFDTELPQGLKPYIVDSVKVMTYKAYLSRTEQQIPATAAVIVAAREPGTYRLMPYSEELAPWPLYANRLVAVDRNGRWINQRDAAQGNILTLGYAPDGQTVGFYPEKGKTIEPYKAYLTYNTIGLDPAIAANSHYDIIYNHYGPMAYTFWCPSIKRLYFVNTEDELKVGGEYNGFKITALWSDKQVTQSGSADPGWVSLSNQVSEVVIDESFADVRPTSLHGWFSNLVLVDGIYGLDYLNTSKVTDMTSTFYKCGRLKELDLTNFDTRNVTSTSLMFYQCTSLETITVGDDWNMNKVTASGSMFGNAISLVGENGTTYDSNVTDKTYAHPDCGESDPGYLWSVPHISLIDLADNSEALAKYDGHLAHVTYNRALSAINNGDGTWTSKAYTVCLPYDIYLAKMEEQAGDAKLYRLMSVTNDYEFIFTNDFNYISAGIPYVAVINKGTFYLDAEKVKINATPSETASINKVYDTFDGALSEEGKHVGWWRGTFRNIENEEGSQMHAFGLSNGQWKIVRNDTERYRKGYIPTFRAYYVPLEFTGNWVYESKFIYTQAGDEPDYLQTQFPAGDFDSDLPDDYGDTTGINPVIHTIDRDGTHRYFDLQGRLLPGPPAKGVYIQNGKKTVK